MHFYIEENIKYAQENNENNFLKTAFSALEKAIINGGLNSATAARLMIASKLIDLSLESLAKKWWEKSKFEKFIIELEEQDTNFIESFFNKN